MTSNPWDRWSRPFPGPCPRCRRPLQTSPPEWNELDESQKEVFGKLNKFWSETFQPSEAWGACEPCLIAQDKLDHPEGSTVL